MRWRVVIPLLLVVLVLTALVTVPFSATGTRLLVGFVDGLSGNLELEYGGGSLGGELQLKRFGLRTDRVVVRVDEARATLPWGCLWRSEVCVEGLSAAYVEVEALFPEPGLLEKVVTNPFWPLPFVIAVDDAAIAEVYVHWDGGEVRSGPLAGGVRLQGQEIHLLPLTATAIRVLLPDDGNDVDPPRPVRLPDFEMPVDLVVESARVSALSWDINNVRQSYDRVELRGHWAGHELVIDDASIDSEAWGEARLGGSLVFIHPYALSAQLELQSYQPPLWPGLHDAAGEFTVAGDLAALSVRGQFCGALPATIALEIDLLTPHLPLSLRGSGGCDGKQPALSLQQLPGFARLPELTVAGDWQFQAVGDLEQQQLALRTALAGPDYGAFSVDAAAVHRPGLLQIAPAALAQSGSNRAASVAGEVTYGEQTDWRLAVELAEFTLPPRLAPLTGQLSGALQSAGQLGAAGWRLDVSDIQVTGTVNGLPAEFSGRLQLDDALALTGSNLDVRLNDSRLQLLAGQAQLPRLDFVVDDVGRWLDDAAGELQGSVRWNQQTSSVELDGIARRVRLGNLQLRQVELTGRHVYSGAGDIEFSAWSSEVALGGTRLQGFDLSLQGTLPSHRLVLAVEGEVSTTLELRGALREGDWRGELQPLTLASVLGIWQLPEPVAIDYFEDGARFGIADHCWLQQDARLCLKDMLLGENGSFSVALGGDLGLLEDMLPASYTVEGPVKATARAEWAQWQLQQLDAEAAVDGGRLQEQLLGDETAEFRWERLTLGYHGDREQGRMQGLLRRAGVDAVALDISMPSAREGELAGRIDLNGLDLREILPFVGYFSRLEGQLGGSLELAGTVGRPQVNGLLALRKGLASMAGNPTVVEGVSLDARFLGTRADLSGTLQMGGGSSRLAGEFAWHDEAQLSVRLTGDEKTFLYPTSTIIQFAEDLLLEMTGEGISLSGTIRVPRGELVVEQLPQGSVSVSSDAVLVDYSGQAIERSTQATGVALDLDVQVADALQVSAQGLQARVGGQLRVTRAFNRPLQILGRLGILEGRFDVLGGRFDLREGGVTFVGAADNPTLDIRAEREISGEQITVGVHVTGVLETPQLNFYSRPALPEMQVMAYVLGGRGIDRGGQDQSLALALAATSGLARSQGLLKGVNLGVEGRDQQSRAAIGGYISERIYLSYGVGLYEPVNTLTVRLDLVRNLWAEVVTGLHNSADIYYAWSIR